MAVSLIDEGNRSTGENHRPVASHWQTLSHNVASNVPRMSGIRTHNFSDVIGPAYIDSCKPNYHVITTTTSSIYWACFQPEYSWNTVRLTSNNQPINLMIGLLNRPRFIMFVIISRMLTMTACHCFVLQGLGYAVPTKNPPWLLKQSFCFTFQMRVINIFFNNRYEHQQKYFYCDFCIECIVH